MRVSELFEAVTEEGRFKVVKGVTQNIDALVKFARSVEGIEYNDVDWKGQGIRVWTRGDGTRYKDPGYVKLKTAAQAKKVFERIPGKSLQVSGEFGSSQYSPAKKTGGVLFVLDNKIIRVSTDSVLRNSSIWRVKKTEVAEGYYTGTKNREIYDDFGEWKKAVRQAGCDFVKTSISKFTASGWDGVCGEFDVDADEGWLVENWGKKPPLKEAYGIKLKDGSWYSEQKPTLGPVKGGNAQVRVFTSMNAADDFLVVQQNSKFGGKKFEDAEIKQYRPKKLKEAYNDPVKTGSYLLAKIEKLLLDHGEQMEPAVLRKMKADLVHDRKYFEDEASGDDSGDDNIEGAVEALESFFKDVVAHLKKRGITEGLESELDEGITYQLDKDGVKHKLRGPNDHEGIEKWKNYSAPKKINKPKIRPEKYSQEWWEAKADRDYNALTPWTRIELGVGFGNLSHDDLEAVGKNQGFGRIDDFHVLGHGETRVHGVICATIRLRVVVVFTKEDDLGLESDDPISDAYNVMVRRDIKDPKKFEFVRYL